MREAAADIPGGGEDHWRGDIDKPTMMRLWICLLYERPDQCSAFRFEAHTHTHTDRLRFRESSVLIFGGLGNRDARIGTDRSNDSKALGLRCTYFMSTILLITSQICNPPIT